ncbi:MAG: hypothetical protein AW09_002038 [Candidatus Accumulibacter phosphatis]|uniref:Uncharacterized protein n=1 Tax=Candidatus Accumulibacter phosphatis TaxID=327160 RepID=A0A080LY01_9PROT|nr:MAG: hypothetical protein AW09_002038 [Candidatus Accumulibacter phosphatis]
MTRIEFLVHLAWHRWPAHDLPVVVAAAKRDDAIAADIDRAKYFHLAIEVEHCGDDAEKNAMRILQCAGDDQAGPACGARNDHFGEHQAGLRLVLQEAKVISVGDIGGCRMGPIRAVPQIAAAVENPQTGQIIEMQQV